MNPSPPRPPSLPLRAALALALAFVYLFGTFSNPPKWEEPRRCLVAHEMVLTGDYLVPRLLGEPYLAKPPLQNWLIALFAGFDPARIGAATARLVSLAGLAAIALALWRLGLDGRPDPLPAAVFLTMGIVVQYGRAGETDMPFAAFTFLALACFEAGRRRGSPALRWVASHALLGLGILTKGIAPLFFHPPALLLARKGRPRPWLAAGAGLLAMVALALFWLVPVRGPALAARVASEVGSRLAPEGPLEALVHVALYPLILLRAMLPWPLVLLAGPRAWRGLPRDPWLLLCGATVAWSALVFLFVPGTLGRYLMPAYPCAAVLLAAAARRLPPRAWHALLAAGIAYGCFFAVFAEARAAERNRAFPEAAAILAEAMREPLPVACDRRSDRRLVWALARRLGRTLAAAADGARYEVAPLDRPPSAAPPLATAAGHGLWRIG